jgi:hypothetical protein
MITLLSLLACGSPAPVECPECPDCQSVEAEPSATSPNLTEWEAGVLAGPIETLRDGIKPFSESSWGICLGVQQCEGEGGGVVDAGTLATGDHVIFAELSVPELGGQWSVNFHMECQTTGNTGVTSDYNYDRSFDVRNGGPNRGYRLMPLARIKAPHPSGARECAYTLTPIWPDGREGAPWTGSYSTAAD